MTYSKIKKHTKKVHKRLTKFRGWGGGMGGRWRVNAYGQPDREISVFFTPSLKHLTNSMYEAIIYCISGEAHSYSHQQNTRDQIALHRSKVVIINKINSI